MNLLDTLLAPRTVAVVGASNDPQRIGGAPLAYLKSYDFPGTIWPINPNRDQVQGLAAVPALDDVPGQLDFALIAVPAPAVSESLRAAGRKGARAAIVLSSGFAEAGGDGAACQAEIAAIARAAGMRLLGPNCMGAFSVRHRFYPTFSSTVERDRPVPGHTAILSQSGALGTHLFAAMARHGLGISHLVTTGNEADIGLPELARAAAEHDDVDTLFLYIEGLRDGRALLDAVDIARQRRKPVVVLKVGRSEAGRAAVASHTAALAGEDRVFDALLREAGAWRAGSIDEMVQIGRALRPRIFPAGRRVGIVTVSGGGGVMMADAAEAARLDVAPMPADAMAGLKQLMPFAATGNPVDLSGQVMNNLAVLPPFLDTMLTRGGYDAILGFWSIGPASSLIGGPLLAAVSAAQKAHPDRLFLHSFLAGPEVGQRFEAEGCASVEDPVMAVRALAALTFMGEAFARGARPAAPDVPVPLPGPGALDEPAALALLAANGVPVVPHRVAGRADEAAAAAAGFGGLVAMKIVSSDIAHKSDLGGVRLGVPPDQAAEVYRQIMADVAQHAPDARLRGLLVAPMQDEGIECILGGRNDPVFGPVVLFGLGGVMAELIADTAIRRAPLDLATACEMVRSLHGAAVFGGLRGRPAADAGAIARAIVGLGDLIAASPGVDSIEINPLLARPQGVMALDALILRKETTDA